MSDDFPRRRRLNAPGTSRRAPAGGNGGGGFTPWLWTIAAALVVVVGGWFLGQGLAHMIGPGSRKTAQLVSPVPSITPYGSPVPSPQATATPEPSPSASPTPAPKATASPLPTAAPKALAAAAPTATPAPPTPVPATATPAPAAAPTAAPAPVKTAHPRTILPVARRPEPPAAATAAPLSTPAAGGAAAKAVRSYIDALKRGDPQSAALYLGNGSPDESFITSSTRITSLTSTRTGDGSYKVDVDMQTSSGEYYETFVVAQTGSGARILQKTAIKP